MKFTFRDLIRRSDQEADGYSRALQAARVRAAYQRNLPQWQSIQDSPFATIRLNNDAAFSSNCYRWLLGDFLLREKERLVHPGTDLNLLQEKIIQQHFTGRTAQYLDG